MNNKPNVFVIMPFSEDFYALFEKIKNDFIDDFDFTNAGDLDNQQNIIKDIVEGIYKADVIIADLTGLNPNVFYELGLAHAMNKKVIIITQELGELPFDIKSYRANEYSLQFNKLPNLIEELKKLLFGAIDNSIKYGNPVFDYIPNYHINDDYLEKNDSEIKENEKKDLLTNEEYGDDKGFLDYFVDINENASKITDEIVSMSDEIYDVGKAVDVTVEEINRVKMQSTNLDANFVRNICRKLSIHLETCSNKFSEHIDIISICWNTVENSYLSLLDNKYAQQKENIDDLKKSVFEVEDMKKEIKKSDNSIEEFILGLRSCFGVERKLNKAITSLVSELEKYLLMTETIASSIDRISGKSQIIISDLEKV